MKKILALLLALLLLFPDFSSALKENPRSLTVMIYMCGSDLESSFGAASRDLEEITRACAGNETVTVLVMIGGSLQWTGGICAPGHAQILEIASRGRRTILEYPGEVNMGDAAALSGFLRYAPEVRPADEYALILWDHGGGPMEGICFDESSGMDSLSLAEVEQALENSPFSLSRPLAWIGFDACLMASLETAHCCQYFAEYMICSQETEPSNGWNYTFLGEIRPGESGETTGRRILDAYMEDKKKNDLLTLSLIDLRAVYDLEMNTDYFFASLRNELDENTFPEMSRIRQGVRSFGRASTGSDYDLADLRSLSEQYASAAPELAESLQASLDKAVLASVGNQENAGGLSIFSPYYNKQRYLSTWQQTYSRFDFGAGYRSFLNRYGTLWTDSPDISWAGLSGRAEPLTEDGRQTVVLDLSEEQAAVFAEAECTVLEDYGSEELWHSIYTVGETRLEGRTLRAEYGFEALYAVDDAGIVETEPIPFLIRNGYYLIYAFLEKNTMFLGGTEEDLRVRLLGKRNTESGELEIISIAPWDENDLMHYGRQSIELDPEKWKYIFLNATTPFRITGNRDGSLLPFFRWTPAQTTIRTDAEPVDAQGNRLRWMKDLWRTEDLPSGAHLVYEADLTRPWKLQFLPLRPSGRDVAAQFTVRDTYGNEWGSELIALAPPAVPRSAPLQLEEPVAVDGVGIVPRNVRALVNGSSTELCVRLCIQNRTDTELLLFGLDPEVNGIFCSGTRTAFTSQRIAGGQECIVDVPLDLSGIPGNRIETVRSISFYPLFAGDDNSDGLPVSGRIRMATDLDLQGLPLPPPEDGQLLSRSAVHDISFELLRLDETEDSLSGRLHLRNESGVPCAVWFPKRTGHSRPAFFINHALMADCLDIPDNVFLSPGGETWLDFEVLPEEGRLLEAAYSSGLPPEWVLRQILVFCFEPMVYRNVANSLAFEEGDPQPFIMCGFLLSRPFFLRTPIQIRMQPDVSGTDGASPEGGLP